MSGVEPLSVLQLTEMFHSAFPLSGIHNKTLFIYYTRNFENINIDNLCRL
jgi:hypothetical protein